MSQIRTFNMSMVRGSTLVLTFTVKDQFGNLVDLTGATAYLAVRTDMKAAPLVQLTSGSIGGWRTGIVISDQTLNTGQFVATFVPADTSALVAAGDDDPYFYDAWIVDVSNNTYPVIAQSQLALMPQVTNVP